MFAPKTRCSRLTTGQRWLRTETLGLGLFTSLSALPTQALAYSEQGRLHDPASWHSTEFKRDWGLAAIGADHAYARGLSGSGVRLGIVDSGVDLRHGEFSGKNNHAVRLANPGCSRELLPTRNNPGCFFAEGDRASIDYNDLSSETRQLLLEQVANGDFSAKELKVYEDSLGAFYDTHGTHVAGTMLANRDGKGSHGVAFAADLSTVRRFSNTYTFLPWGFNQTQQVAPSLAGAVPPAYAQFNQQNVRAINHSWGLSVTPQTVEQLDNELQKHGILQGQELAQSSLDTGVLQVFSAGNLEHSSHSPETAPMSGAMASLPRAIPALEPYWLSVVNLQQDLTLHASSTRCGYSMNWCLAAPGTDIASTFVGGEIDLVKSYNDDGEVSGLEVKDKRPVFGYAIETGTSMAAPHVTGGLALLMERFPYLDNPQIRDVLLTTAKDLGAPGVDEVYGWGLMDLKKAIDGPGQLRVDTNIVMNRRAGGAVVWQGGAWDDWRNDIGGPGRLGKAGAGWLRLSGNNGFAGVPLTAGILELDGSNRLTHDVAVEGGLLRLNGTLHETDLNVNRGLAQINGRQTDARTRVGIAGFLSGDGELSHTEVLGTIMPGSQHRALTVNGDYQQRPGSTLIARPGLNPQELALHVDGHARIEDATLRLSREPDRYPLGQHYRALQADAGVSGDFSSLDRRDFSPFLSFTQTRSTHALGVDVGRGQRLASVARTANQRTTADAADALGMDQRLAQRLTSLFPDQAPRALDQLSGELHASTQSVLIENSRSIRNAALGRARSEHQAVWVQALHQNGRLGGDGNAASVSHSNSGVLIGADHDFKQGPRVGVLLANSRGHVNTGATGKASFDSLQFGLHVGHQWNAFGLYGGFAQGRNETQSKRRVRFSGLDEGLSADYLSHTRQWFIEGNYRLSLGAWDWQPYVQQAHIRTRSDAFSERGGYSALHAKSTTQTVNLTTGGARATIDLSKTAIGPAWLSLNGGAAYTHASGDLQPTSDVAWQGASSMQVAGTPLNSKTLQLELGAVAQLSRDSALSLKINTQRGERSREQGVSAQYQWAF